MEIIESLIDMAEKHYQWVFSGIGGLLISLLFMKKPGNQTQNVTSNSVGVQAGGNVSISSPKIID